MDLLDEHLERCVGISSNQWLYFFASISNLQFGGKKKTKGRQKKQMKQVGVDTGSQAQVLTF